MKEPTSETPTPDDVIAAFLERYWRDQDAGENRPLSDYLAQFPDHEDIVAQEYMALRTSGEEPGQESTDTDSLGPYEIEGELGQGGQGVVYLAEDTRLHRKVALKVLTSLGPSSEDTLRRFQREAEVASKLEHPGICGVHDAGVANGTPYIAMQLVPGDTLAHRIAAARTEPETEGNFSFFDEEEAPAPEPDSKKTRDESATTTRINRSEVMRIVATFEKIARALHAAHEAGIIHRDIKPGNIMLTPQGDPVILDFGLARDMDADFQTLTRTGDFFGTPAYMSPEQLMGQRIRLDCRTDVYSLGATLFECLTLHRPFEAPTREALYQAIMGDDPTNARRLNTAIPKDLRVVLDAALEKNRDRRYQTALDFAEDLRRVREVEPISAKPIGPVGRTIRWTQRRPYRAASVALLFAIVAGVSWYVAKGPEREAIAEKARRQDAEMRRKRVEALLQSAFLDLHSHLFDDALVTFEKALVIDANNIESIAGKGIALAMLDKADSARAWLDDQSARGRSSAGLQFVRRWVRRRGTHPPPTDDTESLVPATSQDHFLMGYLKLDDSWDDPKPVLRQRALEHLAQATLMSKPRCLYFVHYVRAALKCEDTAVARRCIEAIPRLWPDDAYGWYVVATAHTILDDSEEAVRAYERALSIMPSFAVAHSNMSLRLNKLGRHEKALTHAREALRLSPDYNHAVAHEVDALMGLKRYEDAVEACERALDGRPGDYLVWDYLGDAYFDQKKYEKAIAAYEECLRIKRDSHYAWRDLGRALRALKRYDDAIDALRRSVDIQPDYYWAWTDIGQTWAVRGQPLKALAPLQKSLELNKDYHKTHDLITRALMELERWDAAARAAAEAVRTDPNCEVAHIRSVTLALRRSDDAAILTETRRYHDARPNDPARAREMAARLINVGARTPELADPEAALAFARKAVELTERKDLDALLNLGHAHLHNDQSETAVDVWTEAATLAPTDHRFWFQIGAVRQNQKDFEAAATAYERVRSINPDLHTLHDRLSKIYLQLNRLQDAAAAVADAIRTGPGCPDAHHNLIDLTRRHGDDRRMIAEYKRWVRVKADDPQRSQDLARALIDLGERDSDYADPEEAVVAAELAVELTKEQDPAMLATLAHAYAADDNPNQAVIACEKALKLIAKQDEPDAQLKADLEASLRRYKRAAGNQ